MLLAAMCKYRSLGVIIATTMCVLPSLCKCHAATAVLLILQLLCANEIAPVPLHKCCCHCINVDMLPLL